MAFRKIAYSQHLAATGTTGNNTHTAVVTARRRPFAFQFVVEAVGATPTATFKIQTSEDNSTWNDLSYITDPGDSASTSTKVLTAVGTTTLLITGRLKPVNYVRAVVSSNTNVTYRVEMYAMTERED